MCSWTEDRREDEPGDEAPFHPEILDRMLALIERFQRTGDIDPALVSHLLARVFVRLHESDEPRSIDETVQVLVRGLAPARHTPKRDQT